MEEPKTEPITELQHHKEVIESGSDVQGPSAREKLDLVSQSETRVTVQEEVKASETPKEAEKDAKEDSQVEEKQKA